MIKEVQSPAKEDSLVIGDSVARKAFSFSGGSAWLDAEGNFRLEMLVAHKTSVPLMPAQRALTDT